MPDLKTCPFCDAPAQIIYEPECSPKAGEPHMVMCGGNKCAFQPMLWFADVGGPEQGMAEWNRRAGR